MMEMPSSIQVTGEDRIALASLEAWEWQQLYCGTGALVLDAQNGQLLMASLNGFWSIRLKKMTAHLF